MALAAVALPVGPVGAQESLVYPRPVPGPVVPPAFYRGAVEQGTRSPDGSPGPEYWQPGIEYEIDAHLDPELGVVTGTSRIRFRNHSPFGIRGVPLHLHQNLHAMGVPRNEAQELTGGVELQRVAAQGRTLREGDFAGGPAWEVDGTLMHVRLPEDVPPGGRFELEVDWSFTVPQNGAGRMGHSDRELYFVAYWFPKVAAMDDLRAFDAEPYLGAAEFYDAFADYSVSLTVPDGWTVAATGALQNPEEVLSEGTRRRLAVAAVSDTVVRVATTEDRMAGRVTARSPSGELTYRFRAEGVRDFTWTASDVQAWTATSAVIQDRDGDGREDRVAIHAFYRPERAPLWTGQAAHAKAALEHHSRFTGLPYPWPHMTSVEGGDIIGGGMEFPMLTLIGPYLGRTDGDLYNVTAHEVAHMWIPMIVGTNEKRHAWMDEGFTAFLENESRVGRQSPSAHLLDRERYLAMARLGLEEPLMRHGDHYEAGGYQTASYTKSATLLFTLQNLLGEEIFREAYRTYLREWAFKHPAPWDFFNTVERVAGRDLDWFWQAFLYETWVLDQAVAQVLQGDDGGPVVVVEDRGFAPMPARLRIETTRGGTLERVVPVETWLEGATRASVELPGEVGVVTRVEIDPEGLFPDVDRGNNLWERGGEGPQEAE